MVDGGTSDAIDGNAIDGRAIDGSAPINPPVAPLSVEFRDQHLAQDVLSGRATIGRPADESPNTGYALVFLDAAGAPLGDVIARFDRAAELAYDFVDVAVPLGAVSLAGLAYGADTRTAIGPATTPIDNFVQHADVSGELGIDPLVGPVMLRHASSGARYLVTLDGARAISIRRCADDLSACTEVESFGAYSEPPMHAIIHGDRLYAVGSGNADVGHRPRLIVCDIAVDGSLGTCRENLINDTAGGWHPRLAVHANRLYVASATTSGGYARLYVCPIEGPSTETPCTVHDVTTGIPWGSCAASRIAFTDTTVYIATSNQNDTSYLISCAINADGTPGACSMQSVSGAYPSLALRGTNLFLGTRQFSGSAVTSNVCTLGPPFSCSTLAAPSLNGELQIVSDRLYVVRRNDVTACSFDSNDLPTGCASASATTTGEALIEASSMDFPIDDETGNPYATINRCAVTDGLPHDCVTHQVAGSPLGFVGQYPVVAASATHLLVRTRGMIMDTRYLAACALDEGGAIGTCRAARAPVPIGGSLLEGLAVDGANVYLFGFSGGPVLMRCPLAADGTVGACTSTALPAPEGETYRTYFSWSEISVREGRVVAALYRSDGAVRIFSCALGPSGDPQDCSTLVTTQINSYARPIASALRDYLAVTQGGPPHLVYACPHGVSDPSACTEHELATRAANGPLIDGGRLYAITTRNASFSETDTLTVETCPITETGELAACTTSSTALLRMHRPAFAVSGSFVYVSGIDPTSLRIVVATCALDAQGMLSGCTRWDASAGQGDGSSLWLPGTDLIPVALTVEPTRGTVYMASTNPLRRFRASAYWFRGL